MVAYLNFAIVKVQLTCRELHQGLKAVAIFWDGLNSALFKSDLSLLNKYIIINCKSLSNIQQSLVW